MQAKPYMLQLGQEEEKEITNTSESVMERFLSAKTIILSKICRLKKNLCTFLLNESSFFFHCVMVF